MINTLWYKNALIYSLNVETFMDANGDGIGDFAGLIQRLDYLHGLGVSALWLLPFQPSPRRDHGYDVTDYYAVADTGMVFPGVQDSTWDWDEVAQAWYFHRFYRFQPDLNMNNPKVVSEILKIIGFWIEMGVSGFRMDAVPFVIACDSAHADAEQRQYELLRKFRAFAQWRRGDCVLLAEANIPPEQNVRYFGDDGDRLHMMFNFPVNQTLFYALATADAGPLKAALEASRGHPDTAQWCHFLRNHDELDLSGLSDEQRTRVFEAFAPDEDMRLYGRGIRRRLAPMLEGDCRRIELANSLLMSLPGTPVLRYGDEIGMGDDLTLPERASVRTPMQWENEPHAGFTMSDNPVKSVISEGPFSYRDVNVFSQRREPESLLNWSERVIRLRKETPEIGYGDYEVLDTPSDVLGICYESRGVSVIVLHNFCDERRTIELGPEATHQGSAKLINLLSDDHSDPNEEGAHLIMLEPHGYRWYRVGAVDDVLRRRETE